MYGIPLPIWNSRDTCLCHMETFEGFTCPGSVIRSVQATRAISVTLFVSLSLFKQKVINWNILSLIDPKILFVGGVCSLITRPGSPDVTSLPVSCSIQLAARLLTRAKLMLRKSKQIQVICCLTWSELILLFVNTLCLTLIYWFTICGVIAYISWPCRKMVATFFWEWVSERKSPEMWSLIIIIIIIIIIVITLYCADMNIVIFICAAQFKLQIK